MNDLHVLGVRGGALVLVGVGGGAVVLVGVGGGALVLVGVGQTLDEGGDEILQHLDVLVLEQVEAHVEHHEVSEQAVEVAVQAQHGHVSVMCVIYMSEHVQQEAVDLLHETVKPTREGMICKIIDNY